MNPLGDFPYHKPIKFFLHIFSLQNWVGGVVDKYCSCNTYILVHACLYAIAYTNVILIRKLLPCQRYGNLSCFLLVWFKKKCKLTFAGRYYFLTTFYCVILMPFRRERTQTGNWVKWDTLYFCKHLREWGSAWLHDKCRFAIMFHVGTKTYFLTKKQY